MMRPLKHIAAGFTLTELAVVLFIIALLLGGLLMPLSSQRNLEHRHQTEAALRDIREALTGFALSNGRLPCPAVASIATGNANAGLEAVTATGGPCSCSASNEAIIGGAACTDASSVTGTLPWATLGLPETDAWGNRYTYRVSSLFSRVATGQTSFGTGCSPPMPYPSNAAFALCSPGNINVKSSAAGTSTIATNVPAIVISYGENGTNTSNADELANLDGDAEFVSNTSIDDMLVWISSNLLFNRMVTVGKLP